MTCEICGNEVSVDARFCGSCGNEVGDGDIADAALILDALHGQLAPFGTVVLLEGGGARRPRALRLGLDHEGLLTEADQQRFVDLLTEILVWDGFLHAVMMVSGTPQSCVWHVVNGDLFALRAGHAMAVLLYYDALAVTDPNGQLIWEVADAQPIAH